MGSSVSTPSGGSGSNSSSRARSSSVPRSPNNQNSSRRPAPNHIPGAQPTNSGNRPAPVLSRPYSMAQRTTTSDTFVPPASIALADPNGAGVASNPYNLTANRSYLYNQNNPEKPIAPYVNVPESIPEGGSGGAPLNPSPVHCLNPASEVNGRLDTQVEVRVYPCNNNQNGAQQGKKKFTQFTVKPEGVIIQGSNRRSDYDLGSEYSRHIGRKLQRYELADSRACQLLVTSHAKSFYVVPAPEAFSRHSGTCRLLGDRKHPPTPHVLQVGDFLRVGSVGVVVIETHDGVRHKALSEAKIQRIMKDTSSGGFIDLGETDGENSESSFNSNTRTETMNSNDAPVCYMCFDETDDDDNPLITPCKCLGDTRYVHVECLRKWHSAEADNQICFLSSVDAVCSVCKSTFKSDFRLRTGETVKLFKSSLEPPYISLLVATKHEMAQRLFNTRFQLSFSTILKPDRKNSSRALLLGRSSGSDMVLDYRTVSARHASLRFKNGEFIFCDAGSSNGSYLYLRRPVELTSSQSVQFRLGRSMISMKVVNKWNRRFLRAVRRTTQSSSSNSSITTPNSNHGANDAYIDDNSIGSDEEDVLILDRDYATQNNLDSKRRVKTRETIMQNLPPPGNLNQTSPQHLELLYALAYPKRHLEKKVAGGMRSRQEDHKEEEDEDMSQMGMVTAISANVGTVATSRDPDAISDVDGHDSHDDTSQVHNEFTEEQTQAEEHTEEHDMSNIPMAVN